MLHNYNQNSMRTLECDTLIIGGGIAGISAAISTKLKQPSCNISAQLLRKQLLSDNVKL